MVFVPGSEKCRHALQKYKKDDLIGLFANKYMYSKEFTGIEWSRAEVFFDIEKLLCIVGIMNIEAFDAVVLHIFKTYFYLANIEAIDLGFLPFWVTAIVKL